MCAWVAQLVEQRIENPRVGGSNPPPGTIPPPQPYDGPSHSRSAQSPLRLGPFVLGPLCTRDGSGQIKPAIGEDGSAYIRLGIRPAR